MPSRFVHFDTSKPDGVTIAFERVVEDDETGHCGAGEMSRARRKALQAGEWGFVGVFARARITVRERGVGTLYTMQSAGLWGIESDCGESYFREVFAEQCAELKAHIEAIRGPVTFVEA